jgi:hypothetical protein
MKHHALLTDLTSKQSIRHRLSSDLNRPRLQFQSPKQLRISSYDDGGETHRDCANAHGQIKSPSDEKARCHRNSDKVMGGCPNKILDHLPIGSTRQFDRSRNISWIDAHQHASG